MSLTSDEEPIADPRAMRALTHPVRIALIEALGLHGPLTATAAAAHIGETPTTCSFHLRQLAKYGFVADAGRPGARERPWRLVRPGFRFAMDGEGAGAATEKVFREHYLARLRQHWESDAPSDTALTQVVLHVTPEELAGVVAEMRAVLLKYQDRLPDPSLRPADAVPVEVLAFVHPMRDA
ncbi:helix-turn-helix domain-containing protein [Dactylosporangium sp. NPDC005555]|uniref:ArsR/SmtB family transcription factor n=1 Tax=Dactylosporangium sp. NPDC005555 TaxID=3154889 RepID=UPI0033A0FC66